MRRYRNLINRLGLSGKVQYSSFVSEKVDETHVNPQEFVDIIRDKNCPCLGGAISKDIKGEIIPFLDSLDDSASAVDSVNTVVNEAGHLKGYNTDYIGFRLAIESSIKEKKCSSAIIYGYGGVTCVVSHVLQSLGIKKDKIYLSGRNLSKACERDVNLVSKYGIHPVVPLHMIVVLI